WAGSPPSGVELLRRAAQAREMGSVDGLLGDWEVWSAELLESHLSYPILAYSRSQHERESWLAALTAILDTSALVLAGVEGVSRWQAKRTFAMARHAVVDLAQVLFTGIDPGGPSRLPGGAETALRRRLAGSGGEQRRRSARGSSWPGCASVRRPRRTSPRSAGCTSPTSPPCPTGSGC